MRLWEIQGFLYEGLFSLVPHKKLVQTTATRISKNPDCRVLDAGCGTGRLQQYANRLQVVGIDNSSSMLKVAKSRDQEVYQADLTEDWPFSNEEFDVVVSLNVLYTLCDPKKFLEETYRVLRYEGDVYIATPINSKLTPLVTEHIKTASISELLGSVVNLPRLLAWIAVLASKRFLDENDFYFYSPSTLVSLLEAAGFRVVSVESCYAGIDVMIHARKGI